MCGLLFMNELARPFIIGEVGVNHNGSLQTAIELVEASFVSATLPRGMAIPFAAKIVFA